MSLENNFLEDYVEKFKKLNVNRKGERPAPHKPCLLLAVMSFAELGFLTENRIHVFNRLPITDIRLIACFRKYMAAAKAEPDSIERIWHPLLRLKTDEFWHLYPRPSRENEIENIPKSGGRDLRFLRENVEYVYVDDELYKFFLDADARSVLRDALIEEWFLHCEQEIRKAIDSILQEFQYEQELENGIQTEIDVPEEIRKPVFRHLVLNAYDHSCAATGLRFLMFDGSSLLEAAHIRPFSDSHDDRTVNGMALQPTFHRAMDKYLIAPGPDCKWHVSSTLDDRISGHLELMSLEGKSILIPREKTHHPNKNALAWRMEAFDERERERK